MKWPKKRSISLEANSSFQDITFVFFRTMDGLYVVLWTLIFFSLGFLAILIPDWNIQSFAQLSKLFLTPLLMASYVIWHRLGSTMTANFDVVISMAGTTLLALVPFYNFFIG